MKMVGNGDHFHQTRLNDPTFQTRNIKFQNENSFHIIVKPMQVLPVMLHFNVSSKITEFYFFFFFFWIPEFQIWASTTSTLIPATIFKIMSSPFLTVLSVAAIIRYYIMVLASFKTSDISKGLITWGKLTRKPFLFW